MRIANLCCAYPPHVGGMGNVAARHARLLADAGHVVESFVPAHGVPAGTVVRDGIEVHYLRPVVSHNTSAALPQLGWRLRGFDAIYLHYPFFGGAEPAVAAARALRIPYLVFFHMDVAWDGWRGRFLEGYSRSVAPIVLRGAGAVLASSMEYFAHSSAARLGLSDVRERPYGIDVDRLRPTEVTADWRVRVGLDPDLPVILHVGGMDVDHRFKGVPELIRAFGSAGLADRAQLALVGDGTLRGEYAAEADRLGLTSAVRFLGRLDDDDLRSAFQSAAVTVLPSTTAAEAFGIVLIEAMSCGSPTIASDLPGVRTVAAPEHGGRTVPPGDVPALGVALAELIDDEGARAAASIRARDAAVATYSRDAERDRLASDFAELVGRGGPRPRGGESVH